MKTFSYIWLFPFWFTLIIVSGPKETGELSEFIEDAEWIHYSLSTFLNFCYAALIFCGYMIFFTLNK